MKKLIYQIKYASWFKNPNGIKGFAEQTMNVVIQHIVKFRNEIEKRNQTDGEKLKLMNEQLIKCENAPQIYPDDFSGIRKKMIKYSIIIFICYLSEFAFNYFAIKQTVFPDKGIVNMIASLSLAIVATIFVFISFQKFYEQVLSEKRYGSEFSEKRNPKLMILFSVFVILILAVVYYLCEVRGVVIEGTSGNGLVSTLMLVIGYLIPIIGGYISYEKSRYIDAYKNTKNLKTLKLTISKTQNRISNANNDFISFCKKQIEGFYAGFLYFKLLKENYNLKKGFEHEDISSHYCKNIETYKTELNHRLLEINNKSVAI